MNESEQIIGAMQAAQAKHTTLTEAFNAAFHGHTGALNPHIWSSDMWLAFESGRRAQGLFAASLTIQTVKKSRGYSIKADSWLFKFSPDLKVCLIVPA